MDSKIPTNEDMKTILDFFIDTMKQYNIERVTVPWVYEFNKEYLDIRKWCEAHITVKNNNININTDTYFFLTIEKVEDGHYAYFLCNLHGDKVKLSCRKDVQVYYKQAFKSEVQLQHKDFLKNHGSKNATVEYYPVSFDTILEHFLRTENVEDIRRIKIFQNSFGYLSIYDNRIRKRWLIFHAKNAKYRTPYTSYNCKSALRNISTLFPDAYRESS